MSFIKTLVTLVAFALSLVIGVAHAQKQSAEVLIPNIGIKYKDIVSDPPSLNKASVAVKTVSQFKEKVGMWGTVNIYGGEMCKWHEDFSRNPSLFRKYDLIYYVAKGDTVYTYTVNLERLVKPLTFKFNKFSSYTSCQVADGKITVIYNPK